MNAKDGILLIDEFENGLYYSVKRDLWRFIFRLAHSLNAQVFATTHSWDCIEAFQRAAREDRQEEGLLIRYKERSPEEVKDALERLRPRAWREEDDIGVSGLDD